MLRAVVLLTSLGTLLLACQASPSSGRRGPYIRDAALSVEQTPYGPIAGMPHAQAVAIFTRNRPALLRVPGVTNVTLSWQGILVRTEQPDRLPSEVEGLPVLDVLRIAQDRLVYFPTTGGGISEEPATAPLCQTLPEDSSSSGVSLHVAKAPDSSGIVCVRAINGQKEGITCGGIPFRLQKKEGRTWSDAVFQDGPNLGASLGAYILQPGDVLDGHLPGFGRTASPGLYRACFRFWPAGQSEVEEKCSQEFSLP